MSPESLPVKLRQLRGTMSLAEAAERAQIPEQRIRMYEEGVRQPYSKTLKRLAEAYGVPVSELTVNGVAPRAPKAAPTRTVRQRRRRRRAVLQDGERSVEVPVEVSPGERARRVIELTVRPAAGQSAAESARPSAAVALRTETVAVDAHTAAPPARLQPPAAAAAPRPLHAPAGPAPALHQRRRPQGHAAEGAAAGSSDLRDPLAEFRRAYGEFRRSRKP